MSDSPRQNDHRPPRQVLLVDDHAMVREGVAALIGREPDLLVAAQADSIRTALEALAQSPVDIAVVDVSLEGSSGLDLVRQMRRSFPNTPALVISVHDEMLYAECALRAGARGYLTKRESADNLIRGIRHVLAGNTHLTEKISARAAELLMKVEFNGALSNLDRLSDRELQIFYRIGKGMSVREIAAELMLSVKTIESHREHVKHKLSFKSSRALLRYAIEHGKNVR